MTTSPTGGAAVISVTVRYRTSDGKEGELRIDPAKDDAVFWGAAVDRVLLPYFVANYGFDKLSELQQAMAGEVRLTGITIPRHKKLCSIVLDLKSDDLVYPTQSP